MIIIIIMVVDIVQNIIVLQRTSIHDPNQLPCPTDWTSSSSLVVGRDASRKVASESWLTDDPSADGVFRSILTEDAHAHAQGHGHAWSWAKLVTRSVPESPLIGLYDTVLVQPHKLLHVKCCGLDIFQ